VGPHGLVFAIRPTAMSIKLALSLVLVASAAAAQEVLPSKPLRLGLPPVVAAPVVEPVSVPFELFANRPLVRVAINGQGPFPLLLGPEEQQSQIDPELVEELKIRMPEPGKGPDGKPTPAPPLTIDVTFSPQYTTKVEIAIQPLTRLGPEFPAATRPRGVISLSAWRDMLVTLDYSRWKIGIEPGALPEPDQKDVFALNAAGELRLPISLGGEAIDCHVDPWFPNTLLLPAASTEGLQLIGEPRDQGTIRTKEATLRVREGRLASEVVLGPFEVKARLVLLADQSSTATVGTPWLARYAVTYDLANSRIRLQRPTTDASRAKR
jgi:hypothetical protein